MHLLCTLADPLTNAHLTALTLIPCNPIKSEIEAFKAEVRKLGARSSSKVAHTRPTSTSR